MDYHHFDVFSVTTTHKSIAGRDEIALIAQRVIVNHKLSVLTELPTRRSVDELVHLGSIHHCTSTWCLST
jgi:hypothetical protein